VRGRKPAREHSCWSLVTQSFDGIKLGGLHGGEPAADHPDDDKDSGRKQHGNQGKRKVNVHFAGIVFVGGPEERQRPDGRSNGRRKQHADHARGQSHDQGFQQKLPANVRLLGAKRTAETDFADALFDGDEHDIHHADAANAQSERADKKEPADGTGEARRVMETPGTVPRWSPNGQWISFSPSRSFSSGVFIVHPDGTGLRQLTETGGWAVWWPDGERIGFQVVGPDGNQQIQVYDMKSGETRTLSNVHFVGTNFPFDISHDGKKLITTNYRHVSDEIWLLEPAEKK